MDENIFSLVVATIIAQEVYISGSHCVCVETHVDDEEEDETTNAMVETPTIGANEKFGESPTHVDDKDLAFQAEDVSVKQT